MAAWRPYSQIVVPDVCFLHSVGNGEPHYGHLHGRSPFPSIAASETRLGSNSERLFVGFHDFGDSTFIPPAPSVFIDTSATGPVEYVEKSGEPLFWIFVTWKIQVRGSPGSLQSWIVTFSKRMCSHFCKTAAYGHASAPLLGSVVCYLWHRMFDSTRIKLPRRCEARSYATYGPESTGGISAGFRSCLGRVCVPPYSQNACVAPRMELFGDRSRSMSVNGYTVSKNWFSQNAFSLNSTGSYRRGT